MKYVAKGGEPRELSDWIRKNKALDLHHDFNGGGFPRESVKSALLRKQGWLCGYTMLALAGESNCHVEHVRPQAIYPKLATDFDNMLVCIPANGGDMSCGYGAPLKSGKDVNETNFVSPFHKTCESRFRFLKSGVIASRNSTDQAAAKTIDLLNLNQTDLKEMRARALAAEGFTDRPAAQSRRRQNRPSSSQAQNLAKTVLREDKQGRFREFCVAIAQVAAEYAEKRDKRAQRLRAQRPPA